MDTRNEWSQVIFGYFERQKDGRWVHDAKHPLCTCAEGLAEPPAPGSPPPKDTDCLICSNWNPCVGCVLASNMDLDSNPQERTPLQVAAAQAAGWVEVRCFARAIARLEKYLKTHVNDPGAYRELAKIYDHPAYRGKDKRRAIILYQRFVELEGASLETEAAKRRIAALQQQARPPEGEAGREARSLACFTCFAHFGPLTHLAYGVLIREALILVRVGDADPETGRTSLELAGALEKASLPLRWVSGEASREKEQALAKAELQRVMALPPMALLRDGRGTLVIETVHVRDVKLKLDPKRKASVLTLDLGKRSLNLSFPSLPSHQAEQCAALLRHVGRLAQEAAAVEESPPVPKHQAAGKP